MQAQLLETPTSRLGENPLWNPIDRRLYWTDIDGGKLYAFCPHSHETTLAYQGPSVGGFTLQADGSLLLFREHGNIVRLHGLQAVETIIDTVPELAAVGGRFNDVIADPVGRVFCGTYAQPHPSCLYRLDRDRRLTPVAEPVGIANGMGLSTNMQQLLFTDTLARRIDIFDYDATTGAISGRRVWKSFPEDGGAPDGLTIDAENHVWTALWAGGQALRLAPDCRVVASVAINTPLCTSVAFGGITLRDLYLTSAADPSGDGDHGGGLLRVVGAGRGRLENFSRIV